MKLKLLLLILLLPFTVMGATTSVWDRVLIRSTFQYTGGTPGLAKVLTSDGNGQATWQVIPASSGAFAVTNAPNFFTTASTNTLNGPLLIGDNNDIKIASGGSIIHVTGLNNFQILFPSSGRTMINATGQIFVDTAAHGLVMDSPNRNLNDVNGLATFGWGTANQLDFGSGSSSIESHVGITQTYPNGANFNAGGWFLPALLTQAQTNGFNIAQFMGDVQVLRSMTASNGVFQTTTGTSTISSGTNLIMNLSVNGGTGTLNTLAMFTMTNLPPNGVTPTVNVIYTNNAQRMTVTAGVNLPSGATTVSGVALWSISGGITNVVAPVTSSAGVVGGASTNYVTGNVQPNALYMVTNINTAAGAPTMIVPNYRETRW